MFTLAVCNAILRIASHAAIVINQLRQLPASLAIRYWAPPR